MPQSNNFQWDGSIDNDTLFGGVLELVRLLRLRERETRNVEKKEENPDDEKHKTLVELAEEDTTAWANNLSRSLRVRRIR